MSTSNDFSLNVTRFIKAPRERVFAAWTKPEEIMRWFGPDTNYLLSATIDARAGGAFHFIMKTDRLGDLGIRGVYREVTPPSRLVFTWGWDHPEMPLGETLVTVDLAETQLGTQVILTHTGFSDAETRDNHTEGWNGAFDKLERRAQAAAESRMPGHFSWNELAAGDTDAAAAFYAGLFGWEPVPMPGGMPYTLFKKDGTEVAGLLKTKQEGSPAYWVAYVTVADVDASAASAGKSGGTVMVPPMDIPNVGRIALVQDPQGAMFGLFQPVQC